MKKRGAVTIVSKNYISQARILAKSFLANNPKSEFWVLLVDELDDELDLSNEVFNWMSLKDLPLPGKDFFPYQYTILELNTAVKPFVLEFLFEREDFDKLCYIDPDIWIFKELTHVWDALDENSVVLTPHMFSPFEDNRHPAEVAILQSGTYNLGFLGLSWGDETKRLLNWWQEKLYLDCVVDIPNGLFVDQKWMDLVPAYFEKVFILKHPGYNVAYWNLHERSIELLDENTFLVQGENLYFFHFSGYKSDKPDVLSKHQNRHNLKNNITLRFLFDSYGDLMKKEGYEETKNLGYHYGKLPNGLKVSDPIIKFVRTCIRRGVNIPSPIQETDEFVRCLLTINSEIFGTKTTPLFAALLELREDLREAFPKALHDPVDPGLINWIKTSDNYGLKEFLPPTIYYDSPVKKIGEVFFRRADLRNAYPNPFIDQNDFDKFVRWCYIHGTKEEDLTESEIEIFKNSKEGLYTFLNIYFSKTDLQKEYLNVGNERVLHSLIDWFHSHLNEFPNLQYDTLCFLQISAGQLAPQLNIINILNNVWLRKLTRKSASIFNLKEYLHQLTTFGIRVKKEEVEDFLLENQTYSVLNQLEIAYQSDDFLKIQHHSNVNFQSKKSIKEFLKFLENMEHGALTEKLLQYDYGQHLDKKGVNVFGYFDSPTGMGQSANSLCIWLEEQQIPFNKVAIPNPYAEGKSYFDVLSEELIFGWPNSGYSTNIMVANADSILDLSSLIPFYGWNARKNIGYWVWETENFPLMWKNSEYFFDEIWTPSNYSSEAISAVVDLEVKVIPHVLDMDEINKIHGQPNSKEEFGLPKVFTFGFFFDQKSNLARKNPEGLIDAFQDAFQDSNDVQLVLKINSPSSGDFKYEKLKQKAAKTGNIVWIEETFSREKTLGLMNALDAYVSLHRAEGFGLTMFEAKALGKPVIASAYSGNMDFMDAEKDFLVPTKRIKLDKNYGPYLKDSYWGEPDIKEASEIMNELFLSSMNNK